MEYLQVLYVFVECFSASGGGLLPVQLFSSAPRVHHVLVLRPAGPQKRYNINTGVLNTL